MRRLSEQSFVFAAELGWAFVAHFQAGACGVFVSCEHQPLRFVQAQPFLKLERTQRSDLTRRSRFAGQHAAIYLGLVGEFGASQEIGRYMKRIANNCGIARGGLRQQLKKPEPL